MKNKNRYGRPQADTNSYDNDRHQQSDDRYNDYNERNNNGNFNSYQDHPNNSGRDFEERQFRQGHDYREPGLGQYSNYSAARNQGGNYSTDRNVNDNWNRSNPGNDYYNRQPRGWFDRTHDEVSSWFGDDDAQRRRSTDEIRDTNHSGKGPKNYKRSSERIKEDVNDKLGDDWMLDATDIEVEVKGSEIILNGTVDRKDAKRRAEDIADSIAGVTHVQNNLRVNATPEANNKNAGTGSANSDATYSNGARKRESMSHN